MRPSCPLPSTPSVEPGRIGEMEPVAIAQTCTGIVPKAVGGKRRDLNDRARFVPCCFGWNGLATACPCPVPSYARARVLAHATQNEQGIAHGHLSNSLPHSGQRSGVARRSYPHRTHK